MPSLLTHHLFGQKVLRLYGRAFEENINTQDAFIIGCQGPDPFFFCFIGPKPHTYIRFGQKLHIFSGCNSPPVCIRRAETRK